MPVNAFKLKKRINQKLILNLMFSQPDFPVQACGSILPNIHPQPFYDEPKSM